MPSSGTPKKNVSFLRYQQQSKTDAIEQFQEKAAPAYKLRQQQISHLRSTSSPVRVSLESKKKAFISAQKTPSITEKRVTRQSVVQISSRSALEEPEDHQVFETLATETVHPLNSLELQHLEDISHSHIEDTCPALVVPISVCFPGDSESSETVICGQDSVMNSKFNSPRTPPRLLPSSHEKTPRGSIQAYLFDIIGRKIRDKRKRSAEVAEKVRTMKRLREEAQSLLCERESMVESLDAEVSLWERYARDLEEQAAAARNRANAERTERDKKVQEMDSLYRPKIEDAKARSVDLEALVEEHTRELQELGDIEGKQAVTVEEIESTVFQQADDLVATKLNFYTNSITK